MTKTQDMTLGSPAALMTRFALPIIGSYLFQQVYGLTDGFVVGRLIGVEAFAAVGATSFYSWMVLSMVFGFSQGFGVLFAQRFGAKDEDGIRKTGTTSLWLSAGIALLMTLAGALLARPVLVAVRTPAELLEDALVYLYWLLSGTVVVMGYNLAGCILRAFGDSSTPFRAVVVAGLTNMALDFLFVGGFHMGIAGAAIATVIAQALALGYCLWSLRSQREQLFAWKQRAFDLATVKELLRLGVPVAFSNGVISVGGLLVQNVINGYGTLFMAGMTAARRYFGLMEVAGAGLEGAVATYVGQNAGAGNLSRIKAGMRFARSAGMITSIAIAALIVVFAKPLIGLLVSSSDAVQQGMILDVGRQALLAMAICMPGLYMLTMHRAAVQGMGNSLIPMLSGFVELVFRIACVLSAAGWLGVNGVYFAEGSGWVGAAILVICAYICVLRSLQKRSA